MARNKHPEITQARILDTATTLFLEKGWQQTTVQDIVDELGDMTRGAFYHHFKSKDEIIDAVTTRVFMGNNPFTAVEEMHGLNGLEKVQFVLKYSLRRQDTKQLANSAADVFRSPISIGKQALDSIHSLAPCFTRYLEEGVADGSVTSQSPKQSAETLMLLLNIWLSPMILQVDKEEYMAKCVYMKDMYRTIGADVFDDEIMGLLEQIYDDVKAEE